MEKFDFTRMTSDELWAFWGNYRHADKTSRLAVCGRLGKGTKLATNAACNYAVNLSTAMRCKAVGRLDEAKKYERICESIKPDLPDTIIVKCNPLEDTLL